MPDLSQHVLGETETPVALETSDDCREAALALAQQLGDVAAEVRAFAG